ncbi:hypothetical protein PpBr36_03178, partial [Pyricularia pennisetigena]|uniref:hypothetical protein n=1 Tax=Pyricularia pennisetigena TaxID=1578925 RepID=UPI001154BCA9
RHHCDKTSILCTLVTWSSLVGGDADPDTYEAAQLFVVPFEESNGEKEPEMRRRFRLPRKLCSQPLLCSQAEILAYRTAYRTALHRACSYSASKTDGENHLIAEYCRVPETTRHLSLPLNQRQRQPPKGYTCPSRPSKPMCFVSTFPKLV